MSGPHFEPPEIAFPGAGPGQCSFGSCGCGHALLYAHGTAFSKGLGATEKVFTLKHSRRNKIFLFVVFYLSERERKCRFRGRGGSRGRS